MKLEAFKHWVARAVYPAANPPSVWRDALWAVPLSDPLRLRVDPVMTLERLMGLALETEPSSKKDYKRLRAAFVIADPRNLSKNGYSSLFFQCASLGKEQPQERARLVAIQIASAILSQSPQRQELWEKYLDECDVANSDAKWVGFQLKKQLKFYRAQQEGALIAEAMTAVAPSGTQKRSSRL